MFCFAPLARLAWEKPLTSRLLRISAMRSAPIRLTEIAPPTAACATALHRTGQRGDGAAVAGTGVEIQGFAEAGGHQAAVVDQCLVFTIDHVDDDRAAHAGSSAAGGVDANAPDLTSEN